MQTGPENAALKNVDVSTNSVLGMPLSVVKTGKLESVSHMPLKISMLN